MIDTIKRFTNESLFSATSALLEKLHVQFDRETAEPMSIADFWDGPMPQYLKDAQERIQATYFIGIVNDGSLQGRKNAESLGSVADTMEHGGKYDGMFVFAVEAKADASLTRSVTSALTRAFNRIASANPVILFIRQGSKLSISTCERMEYSQLWRQGGGEKLGKVNILRNINCEHPHPGHKRILDSLGDKQYATFEELYKHWFETFSNELLTKKFYSELSDWYAWAVQIAKFPNDIRTDADDAKYNHEACIRLITRLIFVWFLKQKHLIPDEFFDEKYIRENIIENFDPHDKHSLLYNAEESKYYRLVMQNLFFAMLNCPIVAEGKTTPNNRRFMKESFQGKNPDHNIKTVMRYKAEFKEGGPDKFLKLANEYVPFLNGGLFDCLDDDNTKIYYDGFSERKESLEQLYLPDYLFFGDEVGDGIDLSEWYGDRNKKKVSARGLIDILKRYSFTIEENTPYDQEVSLDPELLGKVFENLLAAFNPETQTSARKQTGSFYTPREIVQYMVDESLVAHLKRICGDEQEPLYRSLVSYATEDVALTKEQSKDIMQALYNCRVLDPACGSGAFPMGVLQQMVHVLKRIDPTNEMWEGLVMEESVNATKKAFEENLKNRAATPEEQAQHDLQLQERTRDIEQAFNTSINDPDYARKLYLIEHCIYGVDIQPIATQISKLRFFISLVVDQKPTKDAKDNFGIRPLPNLESKFVTANTLIPLDRTENLFTLSDDVRFYEDLLQDLNHRMFLAKRNKDKIEIRQQMVAARTSLALTMEHNHFIGGKGYEQLTSWDMFDQNASAPFFDPEWMFGVKDGFDVVIGNPPYVDYRKIDALTKKGIVHYDTYKREATGSLYVYFIEMGIKSLVKGGRLVFINPYQYLSANSGKGIRYFFIDNDNCLESLVDVSNIKVFESANTYTCVNTFVRGKKQSDILIFKPEDLQNIKYNKSLVERNNIKQIDEYAIYLSINPIVAKLDKINKTLKDYCEIFCGLSASGFRDYVSDEPLDDDYKIFVEAKQIKRYIVKPNRYIDTTIYSDRTLPKFNQICLFMARMTSHMRVGISMPGYTAGKVNVLCRFKCSEYYLLGLLNAKILDYYYNIKCESLHLNGGALPFDTESIKKLPIPQCSKSFETYIVNKVKTIISLLKDNIEDFTYIEQEIDNAFYHLYNLTYDEVLVIDPSTPITREEYDNFKIE